MQTSPISHRLALIGPLLVAAATLPGCTVKSTEAPALSGPSTLALAVELIADKDSVRQDGIDTANITVRVRNEYGQPVDRNFRAEIFVDGSPIDFGTLSDKTFATTGGQRVIRYTAPPPPTESVGTGTVVTIAVVPIGADYRGEIYRQVDIRVIPPGVILPPNGAPVAAFVVTPTPATTRVPLTFDASGSTDEGVACLSKCTYAWTFGDGTSGSGMVVTHEYRAAGSFSVLLTVTDARGLFATATQTLSVSAPAAPTATFKYSPTTPQTNQEIFFTAEESKPAEGRRIVNYNWNFGDGTEASGVATGKVYTTVGTYVVILTVTDDIASTATATQNVTVASGLPTITLTVSKGTGRRVTANVVAIPATGASITEYRFEWGDFSTADVGSVPTQSHTYAADGTFIITAKVTDSMGRSTTTATTVTIP